ncbi:hypothetical protein BSKO_12673 [Bryopsis sp. KO-2023]|nr:hypothetical protein BSKO_12673 [Bryopsis sp. KO-2023]
MDSCKRVALACLLFALVATRPAAAQDGFMDILDAIIPAPILEFFGRSPPESPEVGQRILSEADILELEKPQEGFVGAGEANILTLEIPPNGPDFPNALITLSMLNEEGDADIYCVPTYLFEIGNSPPSNAFSVWKSDHSQGNDHVFISRNHELYEESKVGVQEDGVTAEAVSIVCSVVGFAAGGSEYVVEIDIDYTDRTLIDEEQSAMQDIFDTCCAGSPSACQQWKSKTEDDGAVSMDFCHFSGSMCNGEGRLLRLGMAAFDLDCDFPIESIAKLEGLEKLEMGKNKLKGDISEILESFKGKAMLEYVQISDNMVEGSLTAGDAPVCDLTHGSGLAFLDLARNDIKGEIPACLFDESTELKEIILDENDFEGPLPEMSPDASLQSIRLVGVGLTGTIPEAIGSMEKLVALNLAENALEGPIPSNLGSALTLRSISLGNNKLEGAIPAAFVASQNLRFVWLQNNRLTEFADEWDVAGALEDSRLVIFDAAKNLIEGGLPVGFLSAPKLSLLELADNKLSGEIPDEPGMLPRLTTAMLNGNEFEGVIPVNMKDIGFFDEQARIRSPFKPEFDLSNNMLSGEIPDFLHADSIPQFLWGKIRLGGNQFGLPCPLADHLRHINDLVCGDKESLVDSVESDIEARDDPREAFKEPFLDFDPEALSVAPASESDEDEVTAIDMEPIESDLPDEFVFSPVEAPSAEQEVESVEVEDVSLLSNSGDNESSRNANLLVASKRGRGIPMRPTPDPKEADDSSVELQNSSEAEAVQRPSGTKAAKSGGSGFFIIGGAAFMFIILMSVIVVGVIRKRQKAKTAEANAIVDLELAVAEVEPEGDDAAMLEGVKPSAPL